MNLLSLILRGAKEMGLVTLWDTITYLFRKRWYAVRFGDRRPSPSPAPSEYRHPGRVVDYTHDGQRVSLSCVDGSYELTVVAPDLVRVHVRPPVQSSRPDASLPPSYAIAKPDADWPACEVSVGETEGAVEVRTARLVCRIDKATGRLTFLDLAGRVISADEAGASWHPSGRVVCHRRIQPDEHFYGLGERTFGLDRRGRRYGTWNTDPRTYRLGQDPVHLCIPMLVGLHSQGEQGYGIFFDNTHRGHFDLGAADPDVASFGAEGGAFCYYFIYGPAVSTVIERYTELTGRMNLPPLWMLGYHQSRWSYQPEARVRKLVTDFREVYQVPCDCIHLDIHYMDGYRCFTWDQDRFPDPAAKIADLHAQGFKVIVIIDPGIRADPEYAVGRDGLEKEVFCTYPDGETVFKGPVWPGDCYFPDFTNPRVRRWWGELYRVLTDVGVDGFWNDMNEPAIFGLRSTTLPEYLEHDLDGRGGTHAEAHNLYGMQMARATTEGLRRIRPDERPVCITRSGWAGVQRYGMSWTGDNRSNWGNLWLSMPMVMNLGLSGLAHTGPDIGGYSLFPSGELFTRWLQMGVFLPFFRSHTFVHSPDQEPWSWGEPYLTINRRYIELRYRLLPYLYTAFWQCARSGIPIVRPLLIPFQEDEATHALDDQFLCGDALLVAPVTDEGATRRSIYLPAGEWYEFWTDRRFGGPVRVEVEAPLERMPLFVRAGSVVPMGPVMQYVGERPRERLTLHLYPGTGESWLYEDDGRTWRFQDGECRRTRFTLASSTDAEGQLTRLELGRRVEGMYDPAYHDFEIVVHGVNRMADVRRGDGRRCPFEWDECELTGGESVLRGRVGLFKTLVMDWS